MTSEKATLLPRCTSVQWAARPEPVRYRQTQGQRPMPHFGEQEVNRFSLKIALLAISASVFATQSDKGSTRHNRANVAPPHQAVPNNTTAGNDVKRGSLNAHTEKQGIHSNQSGTPVQGNQARPGAGSYNRDLLH